MIPITCNAVGDIIALATLVIDVARALNDARGSSSEYRSFIDELNAVHTMLTSTARIAEDSIDGALRDQIIRIVDQCGGDIQQALARLAKFSALDRNGALGNGLHHLQIKGNWYTVEWRFPQGDEAQSLRKQLAKAIQGLTTLLVISEADGAVRFRHNMLRQVDASFARDAGLLRAINAGDTSIANRLDAAPPKGHAMVLKLSDSVPIGVDSSKTTAIAVLCGAVCAMHAPSYDRTVPTALLLVATYILSYSGPAGRHKRALVPDVAYSAPNAVTLLDANCQNGGDSLKGLSTQADREISDEDSLLDTMPVEPMVSDSLLVSVDPRRDQLQPLDDLTTKKGDCSPRPNKVERDVFEDVSQSDMDRFFDALDSDTPLEHVLDDPPLIHSADQRASENFWPELGSQRLPHSKVEIPELDWEPAILLYYDEHVSPSLIPSYRDVGQCIEVVCESSGSGFVWLCDQVTYSGQLRYAASTQEDAYFEEVRSKLMAEWKYVGTILVAIAAIDTAVYGFSRTGTIFAIGPKASRCLIFSSTSAASGIIVNTVLLIRYFSANAQRFKIYARDRYFGYLLFAIFSRLPLFFASLSGLNLALLLFAVAYESPEWRPAVIVMGVICVAIPVLLVLQHVFCLLVLFCKVVSRMGSQCLVLVTHYGHL